MGESRTMNYRCGMRRWPPLCALAAGIGYTVIAGLGSAGAGIAERPAALRLSGASFAQQDWMTTDRKTVVRDTRWGVFEYRYPRIADRTRYLSLRVTADSHRAWAIKNLPIFPEGANTPGPGSVLATTFFDLSQLGVRAGERLKALCFAAELSFNPRRSPPGPPSRCRRVRSERYLAGDDPSMAPGGSFRAGVGAPAPIKYRASEAVAVRRLGSGPEPALPLEDLGPNRREPYSGVQEGDRRCMAGAIARSLDWLNREYNFGVELSAQEFYEGLRDAGVTGTPDTQGISTQPNAVPRGVGLRLAAKMRYVNDVFGPGRIETKVWDAASGAANGGNVHTNLPKSSPNSQNPEDFDAWLSREWQAGEDVELAWISPQSAHIVTLTEVAVDADGNFKVKYREDRAQGSRRGDLGPTDGTIFRGRIGENPDGSPLMGWRFGDAKGKTQHVVKYAIAESPTDEFRPG